MASRESGEVVTKCPADDRLRDSHFPKGLWQGDGGRYGILSGRLWTVGCLQLS